MGWLSSWIVINVIFSSSYWSLFVIESGWALSLVELNLLGLFAVLVQVEHSTFISNKSWLMCLDLLSLFIRTINNSLKLIGHYCSFNNCVQNVKGSLWATHIPSIPRVHLIFILHKRSLIPFVYAIVQSLKAVNCCKLWQF